MDKAEHYRPERRRQNVRNISGVGVCLRLVHFNVSESNQSPGIFQPHRQSKYEFGSRVMCLRILEQRDTFVFCPEGLLYFLTECVSIEQSEFLSLRVVRCTLRKYLTLRLTPGLGHSTTGFLSLPTRSFGRSYYPKAISPVTKLMVPS